MAAAKAVKVELFGVNNDGKPLQFIHAASTAASKGTLMVLSGDRTVSASTSSSSGAKFAGIAAEDKDADDTATTISVWQDGIFDVTASGSISLGDKVMLANGADYVQTATNSATTNTAIIVGTALEAASDGEVIEVDTTRR